MSKQIIKILYCIPVLGAGGVETLVVDWLTAIDRSKYSVDLVTPKVDDENNRKKLEDVGVRVYASNLRNRHFLKKKAFLKKLINDNGYDAIHLHTSFSFDYFTLKWAKEAGVEIRIAHGHTANPNHGSRLKNYLHKRCRYFMRKYATFYTGCTEEAAVEICGRKILGNSNYKLIRNGINTDNNRFDSDSRISIRKQLGIDDKYVIGHIGRMNEQKNHLFLIDIFNECLKYHPDSVLMLIGDGELRQDILRKVKQFNIENNVIFVGITNEVVKYMSAMDHFLFPSRYEGFSIALIEAQCNGLPCTVSDTIIDSSIMLDSTVKVSLSANLEEWTEAIYRESKLFEREEMADKIREMGYDIRDNSINCYYSGIWE